MRFNFLIDKLSFQNLEVEYESSINPDNHSWEGLKISIVKILQQYKDEEKFTIKTYNL